MVQNARGKTLWTNLLMCYCGADMSQDESHHGRCTLNPADACLMAFETADMGVFQASDLSPTGIQCAYKVSCVGIPDTSLPCAAHLCRHMPSRVSLFILLFECQL